MMTISPSFSTNLVSTAVSTITPGLKISEAANQDLISKKDNYMQLELYKTHSCYQPPACQSCSVWETILNKRYFFRDAYVMNLPRCGLGIVVNKWYLFDK